jgi:hypothetical protein
MLVLTAWTIGLSGSFSEALRCAVQKDWHPAFVCVNGTVAFNVVYGGDVYLARPALLRPQVRRMSA